MPSSPQSSQGMILIITMVLLAIISVLSLGVINTGLLQGKLGQTLINAHIIKHAALSMLYQSIKEGKTDKSLNNWFIKAQAQPLKLCLTEETLIQQNCNAIYDQHNNIALTGNLVFAGTHGDWLVFDLNIQVNRAEIQELLSSFDYQLLFQWQKDDQINIRYK